MAIGRICWIRIAWPLTRATTSGSGSGSGRAGSGVAAAAAGLRAGGGLGRGAARAAGEQQQRAAVAGRAFFMAPPDRLGAVPAARVNPRGGTALPGLRCRAMFSERTRFDLRPNRLAERLAARRAAGARAPRPDARRTRRGPGCPTPRTCSRRSRGDEARRYEPVALRPRRPRAPPSPRDFARRGAPLGPDRVLLHASTSEAYGFLFKLLCDPGDEVLVPRPGYPLFEFLAGLESVARAQLPARPRRRVAPRPRGARAARSRPRTRARRRGEPRQPDRLVPEARRARGARRALRRARAGARRGRGLRRLRVPRRPAARRDARRATGRRSPSRSAGSRRAAGCPSSSSRGRPVSGPERLRGDGARPPRGGGRHLPLGLDAGAGRRARAARAPGRAAGADPAPASRRTSRRCAPALRAGVAGDAARAGGRLVGGAARARDLARRRSGRCGCSRRATCSCTPATSSTSRREAYLVVSLLTPPAEFREGVARLLADAVL